MSQSAQIRGDRNIIVQVSGTGNVTSIHAAAHLRLISPIRQRMREPRRDLDLLDPGMRAVPLTGRDDDKKELKSWLVGSRPVSVRALTGPGGSGKTRLALELMFELADEAEDPWDAGFVEHSELRRFLSVHHVSDWGWERNTLIVVDDAASVALELRAFLRQLSMLEPDAESSHLRVLLLNREAATEGSWYGSLVSSDWEGAAAQDLFDPWEPVKLAPVQQLADRVFIFRSTLERAASLTGAPAHGFDAVEENSSLAKCFLEARWADPLLLMMAALSASKSGVITTLALSRPEIALRLAERERERIRNFAPSSAAYGGEFLVQLAAIATLSGGLPRSQSRSVAEKTGAAVGLEYPGGAGAAVGDLQRALPGLEVESELEIDRVRPDLIGEAFLLQAWKAQPSSSELVQLACAVSSNESISSLVRTAQDFGDEQEPRPLKWLYELAGAHDEQMLRAIHDSLPADTLYLREFAHEVTGRLLAIGVSNSSERALLLTNLSVRQSELGQREQGLASIQEAVKIRRELAAVRPEAFRPDLAVSLNNLSNQQSALGQREQALASIDESVTLYRELAAARPDSFRSDLARSLNNLSNQQSDLGQREQALASIEEAVTLYRELAAARPDAFRPDLALSLNNLSVQQSKLGQREQALASIEEAVKICRELAAARPDAFRTDLALSLNTLSGRQSDLGQREQALASIEEAVKIYRELATARPDAFRPDLARSLNNLSVQQGNLGQREQALASIEEAVTLYRELAAARPDAFGPDLALSLNTLSDRQSDLGQREQALASIEEAVTLYRELAAARPDAFRPDLARSLNSLSNRQSDLGQREQALASIEEAVKICRELAAARPDAFRPDLALSLNNLSNRQSDLGQREQALASIEDAVTLYRELAAARPDAFRPSLAGSLNNLSSRQSDLARREQALASIEEAVTLYRELAAARPYAFRPDLARSLNNLSNAQSDLGQREQALASIEEAVKIRRELIRGAVVFEPDLARSLGTLSLLYKGSGNDAGAERALMEGLGLLAPHFIAAPAVYEPLAHALVSEYLAVNERLQREPLAAVLETYRELFES